MFNADHHTRVHIEIFVYISIWPDSFFFSFSHFSHLRECFFLKFFLSISVACCTVARRREKNKIHSDFEFVEQHKMDQEHVNHSNWTRKKKLKPKMAKERNCTKKKLSLVHFIWCFRMWKSKWLVSIAWLQI